MHSVCVLCGVQRCTALQLLSVVEASVCSLGCSLGLGVCTRLRVTQPSLLWCGVLVLCAGGVRHAREILAAGMAACLPTGNLFCYVRKQRQFWQYGNTCK